MRCPDGPLLYALPLGFARGIPAAAADVGGIVFTVSSAGTQVVAECPLPDGTRFRLEAYAGKYDLDGKFRILLLDAAHGPESLPLCPQPRKGWGWTDSAQLDGMPAPAPSFRRLAEDAFTAIVLAAPRLFEAKMEAIISRSLSSSRAAAETAAHFEKECLTDGYAGDRGSSAADAGEYLAPVMAAAASTPMPPSPVALARYAVGQDNDTTMDEVHVSGSLYNGRVVACAGALPARAVGALPGHGDTVPSGCCAVYNRGARTTLSLARPGDPGAPRMGAVLWVRQRAWGGPCCFLLFGGRSARFDKTAKIADPGMRALAGIMLRAREIALADIADAPVRRARGEQAAKEQAARAAEQAVEQALSAAGRAAEQLAAAAGSVPPAASAGKHRTSRPAHHCSRPAPAGERICLGPVVRRKGDRAPRAGTPLQPPAPAPAARCLVCDVEEADHACLYAAVMPAPPSPADRSAMLGRWCRNISAAGSAAMISAVGATLVFPPAIAVLAPLAAAIGGAVAVSGGASWALARRAARQAPAAPAAPALPAGPDPRTVLRAAVGRASGHVPQDIAEHLRRVRSAIETGLARADTAAVGDQAAYILREAALRYVPDTIDCYLALPPGSPRTADGLTPEQEVDRQIGIIEVRIQKVLDGDARDMVRDLEAQGRFLQERLAPASGALAAPARQPATPAVQAPAR